MCENKQQICACAFADIGKRWWMGQGARRQELYSCWQSVWGLLSYVVVAVAITDGNVDNTATAAATAGAGGGGRWSIGPSG